jgi:hypothetical protein
VLLESEEDVFIRYYKPSLAGYTKEKAAWWVNKDEVKQILASPKQKKIGARRYTYVFSDC